MTAEVAEPPLGRRFGIELELNAGRLEVIEALYSRQLIADDTMHEYHCTCDDCDYERDEHPFTAQGDYTVDVELVSHIMRHGSDHARQSIDALADALLDARAVADACNGQGAGNHVHVSVEDMDEDERLRLLRLFLAHQHELAVLAGGADKQVRGYNRPLPDDAYEEIVASRERFRRERPDESRNPHWGFHAWLALDPHKDTAEFRLWNSTRAAWRLHLHADVSVAMVEAAKAGIEPSPERDLVGTLAPFVSPETFAYILAQSLYAEPVTD